MKRISVDFNTMMSESVDIVKLGQIETPNGDRLPPVKDGERVLLYDEELQVKAAMIYDPDDYHWMAKPDRTTWTDVVASSSAGREG